MRNPLRLWRLTHGFGAFRLFLEPDSILKNSEVFVDVISEIFCSNRKLRKSVGTNPFLMQSVSVLVQIAVHLTD